MPYSLPLTRDCRFVGWDFHKQTKGMKFENLSKLLGEVQTDLNNQGYDITVAFTLTLQLTVAQILLQQDKLQTKRHRAH